MALNAYNELWRSYGTSTCAPMMLKMVTVTWMYSSLVSYTLFPWGGAYRLGIISDPPRKGSGQLSILF